MTLSLSPTLPHLLARQRAKINALILTRNRAAGELEELRAQQSPDAARIGQLRADMSRVDADLARENAELDLMQREADADDQQTRAANERRVVGASPQLRIDSSPEVYRKGDTEVSFFRDLYNVSRGDSQAADRLARNSAMQYEERALSTATGAGGDFAPPGWLIDEYVRLARPHRVTADLLTKHELPEGIGSVNLPKIASGTGVGITNTQNTAITVTTGSTTSVSSGITEIAGGQVVSLQLLRQSGIPLDDVILTDLAAEYSRSLNLQVLLGTGTDGQVKGFVTSGTTVTYTTNAPLVVSSTAAASFYNKVVAAANQVATTRYLPADAIVMHPRRWAWILQGLDNDNRPLVVPTSSTNGPGISTEVSAEGSVGQFAGLPVYVDPSIPTDLGAGTNQDQVYVLRRDDLHLWETTIEARSFDATLAAQNSVFFRVVGYVAAIFDRYPGSLQKINGTGLIAPTL